MKRAGVLIAALTGMLLATQAQAQAPGQGAYLGAGYGGVWSDGASPYTNTNDDRSAEGGKIFGGYMWDERWGVELGIHSLGRYKVKFGAAQIARTQTTAFSVAGAYRLPIGASGYSFNARVGVALTNVEFTCVSLCNAGDPLNVDTRTRGASGLIGLGLSAKLSEGISMRADYDHFGSVHQGVDTFEFKDSYDVLSVSIQFLF